MKAGEAGAIEVIVSAMKTHANNSDVCEQGCWALCVITVNGTSHKMHNSIKSNGINMESQMTTM